MGQQIPLFFFHWQKLDLANVPVDPEASPFDLLVEMCLEQEGAFLSALCSSGAVGGSVGHCNQQLEERPFPGEKKTEWLKEFSPAFQMFLVGGEVIVVEIDNRLLTTLAIRLQLPNAKHKLLAWRQAR